jgi:hypothetical protein
MSKPYIDSIIPLLRPLSVGAKCFKESAEKNVSNCCLLEFEDQVDTTEFEDHVSVCTTEVHHEI